MSISDPKALVIYSSPAGTTRQVAQVIITTLKDIGYKPRVVDLGSRDDLVNLGAKCGDLINDYCLWVGTPVYAGHAVPPIMNFIARLPKSRRSYAVPFVTWGGVTSGIALYEMGKMLNEKGYTVLGAAKVLAVHSMMWQFKKPLGENHPDAEDDDMMRGLVGEVDAKLLSDEVQPLSVEALNYQPREIQEAMRKLNIEVAKQLLPQKKLDDSCTQCGSCEEVCPAQAITCNPYPHFGPECFLCYNCVRVCKVGALKADLSKTEDFLRKMAEHYKEPLFSKIFI